MLRTSKIVPLDEALAAVDSAAAVADRRKRAEAFVKDMSDFERRKTLLFCNGGDLDRINIPFHRVPQVSSGRFGSELPKASEISAMSFRQAAIQEAVRIEDDVLATQIERQLRVSDLNAVYADPDRYEAERIWQTYCMQVAAVAFAQGDKEPVFIKKWRELLEEREAAEEYDDTNAIRRVDAQLKRHVGVEHPQLPQAAWEACDRLPLSEQPAEKERLTIKYGERDSPSTNGVATKTRSRRESRPMTALSLR